MNDGRLMPRGGPVGAGFGQEGEGQHHHPAAGKRFLLLRLTDYVVAACEEEEATINFFVFLHPSWHYRTSAAALAASPFDGAARTHRPW